LTSGRLRIGICGVGSIGSRHARVLARRGDVDLYLCDPDPPRLESTRNLAGVCRTTASLEAMLEWELDGIVIATPESCHVPQGIKACRKGIPILMEKPVAVNAGEGRALLDVAKAAGVKMLVGYLLRYSGLMRLARNLLEQGVIGAPVSFHVMLGAYDTLINAKSRFATGERNRLFGDYSHEWDYLHWFLGPVQSVVAASSQSGNMELTQDPNVVDSIMRLENGVTGTVHLDYVQHPGCRQITLIGDRGTIQIYEEQGILTTRLHAENHSRVYSLPEHRDTTMESQHHHFIAVIRGQEEPLVTLADGLRAVSVADALILSCSTGTWQAVAAQGDPQES
jgi:predicted dehydrogenase